MRLKYIDLKLIITGEGPSLQSLINFAKEVNLEHCVEFTGKLQREQLSRLISMSHVNVQFSVAEGFGMTAIEASACGIPTVAFKTTGVIDAIENGENGYLVDNEDLNEFIKKVDSILQNYDEWSEKCKRIARNFSDEIEGHSWMELVESIVKQDSNEKMLGF